MQIVVYLSWQPYFERSLNILSFFVHPVQCSVLFRVQNSAKWIHFAHWRFVNFTAFNSKHSDSYRMTLLKSSKQTCQIMNAAIKLLLWPLYRKAKKNTNYSCQIITFHFSCQTISIINNNSRYFPNFVLPSKAIKINAPMIV